MVTGLLPELSLPHSMLTDWVSRGVSAAIRALFKQAGRLEARVRAEPMAKLLQGRIDSFELVGQNLQMYNGLRLSLLELFCNAVAIDFSQVWQGRIRLRQPVQARMRVVLSEADTPFVLNKLAQAGQEGQPLSFHQVEVRITPEQRLQVRAKVQQGESRVFRVGFSARVEVIERRRICLADPFFEGDTEEGRLLSRAWSTT
jgi:hypothetical protein